MKKQNKKEAKKKKMRILDEHDIKGYFRDLSYLGRLSYLREGTRDWIENRMYELRDSANCYEHKMGEFLIKNKIDFIHQAPFVFRPKTIYFCDFFLPEMRLVIEVDGNYHQGAIQAAKDAERDYNFKSVGIRVIRVFNEEVNDIEMLKTRLSQYIKFK